MPDEPPAVPAPAPASAAPAAAKPPRRNLVVCLDGTANLVGGTGETNVVHLYELLDLRDPEKQIAYYDPGVGTFSASGAWGPLSKWLTRTLGLAFGIGLRQNLGEAYTWLMHNWRPGDRVFIFGFSRGAYNALALSGMLTAVGLARPGSDNLLPYFVKAYARRGAEHTISWREVNRLATLFARYHSAGRNRDADTDGVGDPVQSIPVQYMGIWDAVKANGFLKWDPRWPYTRTVRNVLRMRHAVSLDERRAPYRPFLTNQLTPHAGKQWSTPVLEEAWFAGVHSDVGGGYFDPLEKENRAEGALGRISLKWILEGAVAEGLLVRDRKPWTDTRITDADTAGTLHRQSRWWMLLGYRTRPVETFSLTESKESDVQTKIIAFDDGAVRSTTRAGAAVHSSVREHPDYEKRYRSRLTEPRWIDADWKTTRKQGMPPEV